MPADKPTHNKDSNIDKINHLINYYSHALALMQYEGELVWTRFNAMVVAQSVFLALIGVMFSSKVTLYIFQFPLYQLLSLIGIIQCCFWIYMTARSFSTVKYYTLCARELEDKIRIDNKNLNILNRGKNFFKDKEVVFKLEDRNKSYKRPFLARFLFEKNTEFVAYLSIVLFLAVYLGIFLVHPEKNSKIFFQQL